MVYKFRWRDYEDKIYARVLPNGDTGCMVRIETCSLGKYYIPSTNDEEVWKQIHNTPLYKYTDLETAKKNLEIIAEKCKLKLIKERYEN